MSDGIKSGLHEFLLGPRVCQLVWMGRHWDFPKTPHRPSNYVLRARMGRRGITTKGAKR